MPDNTRSCEICSATVEMKDSEICGRHTLGYNVSTRWTVAEIRKAAADVVGCALGRIEGCYRIGSHVALAGEIDLRKLSDPANADLEDFVPMGETLRLVKNETGAVVDVYCYERNGELVDNVTLIRTSTGARVCQRQYPAVIGSEPLDAHNDA